MKQKPTSSRWCLILTLINFFGIWLLIIAPMVLAMFGVVLPIAIPYHALDITMFLVAIVCGVGVKSIADIVIAYFSRGSVNNENPKE
mgnify:CR=1 FL=1